MTHKAGNLCQGGLNWGQFLSSVDISHNIKNIFASHYGSASMNLDSLAIAFCLALQATKNEIEPKKWNPKFSNVLLLSRFEFAPVKGDLGRTRISFSCSTILWGGCCCGEGCHFVETEEVEASELSKLYESWILYFENHICLVLRHCLKQYE